MLLLKAARVEQERLFALGRPWQPLMRPVTLPQAAQARLVRSACMAWGGVRSSSSACQLTPAAAPPWQPVPAHALRASRQTQA